MGNSKHTVVVLCSGWSPVFWCLSSSRPKMTKRGWWKDVVYSTQDKPLVPCLFLFLQYSWKFSSLILYRELKPSLVFSLIKPMFVLNRIPNNYQILFDHLEFNLSRFNSCYQFNWSKSKCLNRISNLEIQSVINSKSNIWSSTIHFLLYLVLYRLRLSYFWHTPYWIIC